MGLSERYRAITLEQQLLHHVCTSVLRRLMECGPSEAVSGIHVEVRFPLQKDPNDMDVPVVGSPAQCPRPQRRLEVDDGLVLKEPLHDKATSLLVIVVGAAPPIRHRRLRTSHRQVSNA